MTMILLDILVDGSYYTQLRYHGKPYKDIIDGRVTEVYDGDKLKDFVLNMLPSLKNREFSIYPTEQSV
jgi:hypothetical protein